MTNHFWSDLYFWKVFLSIGIPAVFVLITLKTGASPLFWMSLGFAMLEAGLRQLISSLIAFGRHYWHGYPRMLRVVRAEVAARAGGGQ